MPTTLGAACIVGTHVPVGGTVHSIKNGHSPICSISSSAVIGHDGSRIAGAHETGVAGLAQLPSSWISAAVA